MRCALTPVPRLDVRHRLTRFVYRSYTNQHVTTKPVPRLEVRHNVTFSADLMLRLSRNVTLMLRF